MLTAPEAFELAVETDVCLHLRFERLAATAGSTNILFDRQYILSYTDLNQLANQVAHTLRERTQANEPRVGICLDRSFAMIAGLLGVLKAGGVYVPLDPAYPPERLRLMAKLAELDVILTQKAFLASLDQLLGLAHGSRRPQVILLDTIDKTWVDDALRQATTVNPTARGAAESAAYIVFTSGSTGTPKGVIGLHGATLNRCRWMWEVYPFEDGERCCQKTTLSFVDSVWEIFGPLLAGVPLVLIPQETVIDPARFVQTLARERVSRLVLVPSLLRVLLELDLPLAEDLSQLRYCISSGEALQPDLVRLFHQRLGQHCTLLNIYGSSEVAADATCFDTRKLGDLSTVPIGQAIANVRTYILDTGLKPVGPARWASCMWAVGRWRAVTTRVRH
ncbi:amino acid adenylation domain-containing protein [Candidatus Gracilibacteria bacterium]|nr:amino acid adenylation domain-containing protein [Candidatus Gracilibacteria bacterium]